LIFLPFILVLPYLHPKSQWNFQLLFTWLFLPFAARLTSQVRSGLQGASLIPLLAKTAKFQLWFSTTLAVALLWIS
jgi:1,4-dihydroxy-2-naphthoate octaprenyltransferase